MVLDAWRDLGERFSFDELEVLEVFENLCEGLCADSAELC